MELVEIDKKELQELAVQVIDQMEQNIQDYKIEAKKRGYYPILTDKA